MTSVDFFNVMFPQRQRGFEIVIFIVISAKEISSRISTDIEFLRSRQPIKSLMCFLCRAN